MNHSNAFRRMRLVVSYSDTSTTVGPYKLWYRFVLAEIRNKSDVVKEHGEDAKFGLGVPPNAGRNYCPTVGYRTGQVNTLASSTVTEADAPISNPASSDSI
jgi:hypothetical protein